MAGAGSGLLRRMLDPEGRPLLPPKAGETERERISIYLRDSLYPLFLGVVT
jgi:hypothetical protein